MSTIQGSHQRDSRRTWLKPGHMKELKITHGDVGKVFVRRKGEEKGALVTRETFATIPVAQIQVWDTVTEFDVNTED